MNLLADLVLLGLLDCYFLSWSSILLQNLIRRRILNPKTQELQLESSPKYEQTETYLSQTFSTQKLATSILYIKLSIDPQQFRLKLSSLNYQLQFYITLRRHFRPFLIYPTSPFSWLVGNFDMKSTSYICSLLNIGLRQALPKSQTVSIPAVVFPSIALMSPSLSIPYNLTPQAPPRAPYPFKKFPTASEYQRRALSQADFERKSKVLLKILSFLSRSENSQDWSLANLKALILSAKRGTLIMLNTKNQGCYKSQGFPEKALTVLVQASVGMMAARDQRLFTVRYFSSQVNRDWHITEADNFNFPITSQQILVLQGEKSDINYLRGAWVYSNFTCAFGNSVYSLSGFIFILLSSSYYQIVPIMLLQGIVTHITFFNGCFGFLFYFTFQGTAFIYSVLPQGISGSRGAGGANTDPPFYNFGGLRVDKDGGGSNPVDGGSNPIVGGGSNPEVGGDKLELGGGARVGSDPGGGSREGAVSLLPKLLERSKLEGLGGGARREWLLADRLMGGARV